LTTQHCVETVIGHRSEVWSMALSNDHCYFMTGTADMELKVWSIDYPTLVTKLTSSLASQVCLLSICIRSIHIYIYIYICVCVCVCKYLIYK
jgi:WD40 repeat protein